MDSKMNERIRELAVQAGAVNVWEWASDDVLDTKNMDAEKFAELIVRECADNIAGNIDLINPESSYNYGLRRAMNSVKEHFGVEE
jgi:hypothetical protein